MNKQGKSRFWQNVIVGLIVIALIALAIFIVYEAFFGNYWVKVIFWGIVALLAIIGTLWLIGAIVNSFME